MGDEEKTGESTVTLKWGAVVVLVLGFFGWLLVATIGHESRITKMETQLEIHIPQIKQSLETLTKVSAEIRDDQIRRQKKEN